MDKNKLYYLAHPYSNYGDPKQNVKESIRFQRRIKKLYGISTINPLTTIPESLKYDSAMDLCFKLVNLCDGVIMSGHWRMSKGCKLEYWLARERRKEIWEYIDGEIIAEGE